MIRKKIAVFASGRGSNALNLCTFFENHPQIEISFVLSNKADAPVVQSCKDLGVRVEICSNSNVEEIGFLVNLCRNHKIDYVVLAGFLRKIPTDFVAAFPSKIINIHPSLLPKYGGEGMYGKYVHQAVLANKETETGITIHFVNAEYDKGEIIAQFRTKLNPQDTLDNVQDKIHQLEMENFPPVLENLFLNTSL